MSKIPADDPRRRFILEPLRNPDGTPFTPEQDAVWRAENEIRRIEWNKAKEERRLERERRLQARREEKVNDDSSGQDETHQE